MSGAEGPRRISVGEAAGLYPPQPSLPAVAAPDVPNLGPSWAQQRFWLLQEDRPQSTAYHVRRLHRLIGPLHHAALAAALDAMVARHEPLRTCFAKHGDGFRLHLESTDLPPLLRHVDLRGVPPSRRSTAAARCLDRHLALPFDLAVQLPVRAVLLQLDHDEHLLVLVFHHVAFDGHSDRVFHRELGRLYDSYRASRPNRLPALAATYSDFRRWECAQQARLEPLRKWWRRVMAPPPALLELPYDRPRRPSSIGRADVIRFRLTPLLAEAVQSLAQSRRATLFAVFLTSLQILLRRYTGEDDLLLGAPVANRAWPPVEDLVGCFTNTLLLRCRVSEARTFSAQLDETTSSVYEALTRSEVPLHWIVEDLAADLPADRQGQLLQILLSYLPAMTGELRLTGLECRLEPPPVHHPKLDLSVQLQGGGGRVDGAIVFDADRFDATTVHRLQCHWLTLLQGAVTTPDLPLAQLSIFDRAERWQLIGEWGQPHSRAPAGPFLSLAERIVEQARRSPHAPAVLAPDGNLSYGDLASRSFRLAAALVARGMGPERVAAVLLEPSIDLLVALLAVLRTGGAFMVLERDDPPNRWSRQLAACPPCLLLARDAAAIEIRGSLPVVDPRAAAAGPDLRLAELPGSVGADDLAYVLFTSGSTGEPKPVAIGHGALAGYVDWASQILADRGRAGDPPLVSRIGFDASLKQLFAPLVHGGTVRILLSDIARDPERLLAALHDQGVEVLNCIPSLWEALLDLVESGAPPPPLRRVLLGGERLTEDLLARSRAQFPGLEVFNLYGPTEATANAAWARLGDSAHLGRPAAAASLHVLDSEGRLVPTGAAGELFIGGRGLARGYPGLPGETAKRFVPDPWSDAPGGRLYRTGDRVRRTSDGRLHFLGRSDDQLKVRGFRIEPAEVEARLRLHRAVVEAAVVAPPGEESLVAYVVLRGDRELPADELNGHLRRELPVHMVPGRVIAMETLPRLSNGKVDRRALAARSAREAPAAPSVPARNAQEAQLAALWSEVLEGRPVGVYDDFFALGGHSLLAARLAARLRRALGVEISVRRIFETPTVAEMAALLGGGRAAGALPLAAGGPRRTAPLSSGQRRLWYLDRVHPGSAYLIPSLFRVTGDLDVPALAAAIDGTVRRHEALRTTFPARTGRPVQRIGAPFRVRLALLDLTALPSARRSGPARRWRRILARRPFDLARGPLLRTNLLRLGASEHHLLINLHHIVSDAWSQEVLLNEIACLYSPRGAPRPALPALPLQYADYAVWQQRCLDGGHLDDQVAWWCERLAGLEPIALTTDRPRPSTRRQRGGRVELHLGSRAPLEAIAERSGTTVFVVLLAAFQALLHRHTGQADLAVGTPVANRSWPELEGLIGFFVNTAVLRQRLNGRVGFHELLAETRETVLDALAHQEAPFERLVAELRPERDPAFQPLAQVAFAYQNVPHHEPRPPGLRLERLRVGTGSSKFDLSLVVSDASDALRVVLEYDSDLFDRTTATRFADGYARLLAAALRDPDLPLTELEVLTPAQRHLVRAEWNDSRSSWPNEPATVVEMVDRAVRRYPSRTAVSLGRQRLDYRQLDDLAEQIADALADRGVGAGHRVAVLLRRSPVLVAAQLAVMRTGAAYVPLDPSAPPRRLRDLLTDAAAVAVVAEADLLAPLAGNHPLTLLLPLAGHRSRHRRAPRRPPDPAQAAYLIFTSGSTGRPRGVEISHGSLRNLVLWHRETYGVGTDDRASLLAGLAFDATVWETWPYLTAGASLHLPAERVRTEPRALRRWLARTGITMAFLPTPLAEAVMAAGDTAEAAPRLLHTGGDRLHARPPAGARFTLVNHYGPTETTVVATAGVVPSEPAGSLPDIGRPIANLEVHVVDAGLYTVPIGVAGELLVGGVGLALGYSGLPRQTAEHFVPDPFVARPGGRLYRTGDFVRHRADGRLDFLGRLDDQIQLHGVRIEPGEVESALAEHPRIAAAAVAAQETGPGRVQLTGFFVARGEAPGEEELRDFLAHRLPATLVPVRFVQLDALPLTANGKVDRRRLPRPALTVASPSRPLPDDPPLRRLAEIWCSVLSLEAVGLDDDFFRLGGDSLSMIEMIARARRAGLAITAEQVMRDRTIARLAPRFGEVAPPPAAAGRVGPEPPLTPIQHWFFEHDLGDRDHWNVSVVLAVPGDLSTSHLRTALSVLVAHHDSLRLRFTRRNGSWQQRVVPASSVAVSELDGRRIGNAAAARLLQRAGACIQTSLSIENGPLLRAFHLRRREPGADRVLLVVHHLAADGISLGVLIRDLETVYGQLAAAVEPRLQEVPTSFARWAHSLRDHVESPSLRSQVAYWTSRPWHLATPLPSRDNGGGRRRGEARAERVRSGVERTRDLLGAASELGCDVSDLALAAAVLALARASGGRRLLVALVQHGRIPVAEGLALDRTVGWFSSIFPVLFELPDRASADAVLTQVRRRLAEVPEGGIGYGLLRYAVGDPGVRRIPHHQVSFNYLGRLGQASSRPGTFVPTGESAGPLYSPRGSRPSELAIFVSLGRDGLDTRWIYGRDQLPRRTVLRLTTTYERALAELARSKGERNDEC